MNKFGLSTLALLAGFMFAAPSQAYVITGDVTGGSANTSGGVFQFLNPPPSQVGQDNQQSDNLYAFNEDQNIVLTSGTGSINVDYCANTSICGGLILPIGTTVASHYVFFDPAVNRSVQGWVKFDAQILAVIHSTTNLANSDFLINNAVTYNSPSLRGLEYPNPDTYSVSGDTLTVNWTASTPGDYVRVLTAFSPVAQSEVPAPGALALVALGLFGLGIARRKFI